MQQGINALMEMGIPIDVATDAMQRTNGNLENAVNFIFSNELPTDNNTASTPQNNNNNNPFRNNNINNDNDSEHLTLNESNSQLKPGDLNHIIDNTNNQPITENEQLQNIPTHPSSSSSSSSTTTSIEESSATNTNSITNSNSPDYSTMNQPAVHKLDMLNPTMVLPLPRNSLIENYLAIFAYVVARYMPKWFLIPDFKDLNHHSDWYKGLSLNEPLYQLTKDGSIEKLTQQQQQDEETIQPETLWQLQRLISIINNPNSQRAYISPNIFSLVFDNDLRSQMQNTDKINELLPGFIRSLIMDLELCPHVDKVQINNAFITKALYKPENTTETRESNVMLLHFPPEEYDTNLYKMLNRLLYPDDDDLIENDDGNFQFNDVTENSLKDISPFLTIIFSEMDEMTEEDIALPDGVDIPFEFYPQLYSVATKNQLIKHIIIKRKQAEQKLKSCLHEMQTLKNFQGKNILNVLDSSINYIDNDSNEANGKYLETLQSIKQAISQKLSTLKEEYQDLTSKLQNEWNLSHPDYHIIQSAKKMGLIDEPHLLVMITLSPYTYFVRDKKDLKKWSLLQSNSYGTDYQIVNNIDEIKVKETIMKFTTRPNETPIMFNYCKSSHINSDDEIMEWIQSNEGCNKFMQSDDAWLKENMVEEMNNPLPTRDDVSVESKQIDD